MMLTMVKCMIMKGILMAFLVLGESRYHEVLRTVQTLKDWTE
jgi:hypothetical protein